MNSEIKFLQLIQQARDFMEEHGFSYTSVACCMRTWRSVYKFALSKGCDYYSAELAERYMLEKYNMSIGENAINKSSLSPYMTQKIRSLRALTDFMLHGFVQKHTNGQIINWPDTYKEICENFINEYKSQGYASTTCRKHELNLYRFISYLWAKEIKFENIQSVHIHEYFKTLTCFSKSHLAQVRGTLIHALKYFHKHGVCVMDLSEYVPKIHYHAQAKLLKVWNETEIEKMLHSIDRLNPVGKRDYAIMIIAANLGLRTGDIIKLTINNFDWHNGCISLIQQKTKESLTLPLTEQIGKAVIDYWMNGRPHTISSELFVSHTLPYKGISKESIYHIFNQYYEKSGIQSHGRKHGIHSFRHSLASRLLEKDTPVNVIGNILGHVNSESASYYLRIDIEKLRQCSLEVPEYE